MVLESPVDVSVAPQRDIPTKLALHAKILPSAVQISTDNALAQTLTLVDRRLALVLPAPGQQVTARVNAAPVGGTVGLTINGASIQAQTTMALRSGESLQLQVAQVEPTVVLKVVPPAAGADQVQQALRAALPKQLPLVDIVANLKLIAQGVTPSTTLPAEVRQAAHQIVANLPQATNLTSADAVRQALMRAGPFLEAALLERGPALKQLPVEDFKAGLLNLRTAVTRALNELVPTPRPAVPDPGPRPGPSPNPGPGSAANPSANPARPASAGLPSPQATPIQDPASAQPAAAGARAAGSPLPGSSPQPQAPAAPSLATLASTADALGELLRQTEGAIARTELHQLVSLAEHDGGRTAWSLELPLRGGDDVDVLQLMIEHRRQGPGAQGEGGTSVAMALNLDGLGEVYAHLTLAGDTLKVVFWAERESTVGRIRDDLDLLVERLERAGLSPEPICCHLGAPRKQAPPRRLEQLLDLMA